MSGGGRAVLATLQGQESRGPWGAFYGRGCWMWTAQPAVLSMPSFHHSVPSVPSTACLLPHLQAFAHASLSAWNPSQWHLLTHMSHMLLESVLWSPRDQIHCLLSAPPAPYTSPQHGLCMMLQWLAYLILLLHGVPGELLSTLGPEPGAMSVHSRCTWVHNTARQEKLTGAGVSEGLGRAMVQFWVHTRRVSRH